jgi:hypothetical protein
MATERITLKNKKTGRKVTLVKKPKPAPKEKDYTPRKRFAKSGGRA